MRRYFAIFFTIFFLVLSASFISIELYLGCHADASENDYEEYETRTFEYYYNDTDNEEPAMSDTGAYLSTSGSISSETIMEIKDAQAAKEEKNKTEKKPEKTAIDTTVGSYRQIVNRDYKLPEDYRPEDLTEPDVRFIFEGSYDKRKLRQKASDALEELFAAAEKKNLILYAVSGFRSYERQDEIYTSNLSSKGSEHTNQYSAKPGTSEHQTGLAIDVSSLSAGLELTESFASTDEGIWLAKNCWKYGYILRYPKEKEKITGYAYEPWHIRYVGKKLAKEIYDSGLCMEEYYGCD